MLSDKEMCSYYDLNAAPGTAPAESGAETKYGFLDNDVIKGQLISFSDDEIDTLTLNLPTIHCSSCVFVLEKLYRLNPGIKQSTVDFLRKELTVKFNRTEISLREVVELTAFMGYAPNISLSELSRDAGASANKDMYIKIGIAGFSFGNIMLLSLPEYLALENTVDPTMQKFFSYLILALSLPVLLISARDYFKSAIMGLRQKLINIDTPISLGILTLFTRSAVEIISGSGVGYMDSFVALVFLLLIGKLFQQKSYDTLSFDRDYKSYFPISVIRKSTEGEEHIPLTDLQIGDRIIIRSEEIIPADAILIRDNAIIDYSFVTGETEPVEKKAGDMIYAGGRQKGGAIELDVVKEVSQSYLTRLWNKDIYNKHNQSHLASLTDSISKYFTVIVILIALSSAIYWFGKDMGQALNAFTAVLIIACPCALALSAPFTLGTAMRVFGKAGFYIKNANVIECLAEIRSIVFDKTGTLTHSGEARLSHYSPDGKIKSLSEKELQQAGSLTRHSNHPLSQQIYNNVAGDIHKPVEDYREDPGRGIEGRVDGKIVRLGSADFVGFINKQPEGTTVFMSVDGVVSGYFLLNNSYRNGLEEILTTLNRLYNIHLLSGDRSWEKARLREFFKDEAMHFEQSPFDKREYIDSLQNNGETVLMIGDGLNDAGSLKQSDVGISISEDKNAFSPACDGILEAARFKVLPRLLKFSKNAVSVIHISFIISFLYNVLGMSIAVTGKLSPLISAILMPVSSISVVAFATLTTKLYARRRNLL